MKLTPLDLRKQQFKKVFRGYDPDEVRGFVEKLAQDWEEVLDEKRRAEERVDKAEEKLLHYEKVELALQEALDAARETGRRAEDAAHERARLIVEEAELRAQRIVQDAEQERYGVKQDLVKLTSRQNEIAARLRAFLMSEMEVLAQFQGDDPIGFIKLVSAHEGTTKEALPAPRAPLEAAPPAAAPAVEAEARADELVEAPEPSAFRREEDVPSALAGAPEAALAPEAAPEVPGVPEAGEVPGSAEVSEPRQPEAPEAEKEDATPEAPPAVPEWAPDTEPESEAASPIEAPPAPESAPEPEPAASPAPEPASPSSAPTYRDWLSGLAARRAEAPAAGEATSQEPSEAASAASPAPERGRAPFGRTFFRPPAPEPPQEPAPSSDAARGWSLRSIVTGDREEAQPEVAASDDERERIRRILEDLD